MQILFTQYTQMYRLQFLLYIHYIHVFQSHERKNRDAVPVDR